jgi:hypothetical protein
MFREKAPLKRFYMKFRIILLTLAFGLASVPFFRMIHERWTAVWVDVPRIESDAPLYVKIQRKIEENTLSGGRDLSLYEYGGDYTECEEDKSAASRECEANLEKIRQFIWKRWNDKKQSYVSTGKKVYILIEPDTNGEWHILHRWERNSPTSGWKTLIEESEFNSVEFWRWENGKESKRGELRLWFCDWEGKCFLSI